MAKASKPKAEKVLSLETVLMNCRNDLRGYGSFERNRDAVIGLVFLKFASDKFYARRDEIQRQHPDIPALLEKVASYNAENVYYLPEECRWDYLVKHAGDNDIAVQIDNAMATIEAMNPPLKGALPQNSYANLGAPQSVVKSLIDDINKITKERYQEEDLIGRVYEYFLQNYAASASKDDGEFYTPACVVKLIAELIEPFDGVVYDPCCGTGGMFVQSVKFVERHQGNRKKISVVGQESNPDTWRLAKMNLAIRGIACDLGQKPASSFTEDQHKNRVVDFIMANPPFNYKKWRGENDLLDDSRFQFAKPAMPPVANANYAWILHMLSKLDVNHGIAGFLLANGALNAGAGGDDEEDDDAGGAQYLIRKKLIEKDKIEAIIVLPRDMFYTTDISVTLWIMNNNKKAGVINGRSVRDRRGEVLFVDLRSWDGNSEEYIIDKNKKKKKTILVDEQISKVRDIYQNWQSASLENTNDYACPELYRSVSLAEIAGNNFNLAPSKYIEFIDRDAVGEIGKAFIDSKEKLPSISLGLSQAVNELDGLFNKLGSLPPAENDKALFAASYRALMGDSTPSDSLEIFDLVPVGTLLNIIDRRNSEGLLTEVSGIDIKKRFIESRADVSNVDLKKYKVVLPGELAYSGMQTGRDKCIRIALNDTDGPVLISPAYSVFSVDPAKALPEFLQMWFSREESDRLGWFMSDASIRANLDIPRFFETLVPLPPLPVQKEIVAAYKMYKQLARLSSDLIENLNCLCSSFVKGLLLFRGNDNG